MVVDSIIRLVFCFVSNLSKSFHKNRNPKTFGQHLQQNVDKLIIFQDPQKRSEWRQSMTSYYNPQICVVAGMSSVLTYSPLSMSPGMVRLDLTVDLCLVLLGASRLISTVAEPIYTLTRSV